jgi:hypothetical protein
MLSHEELWAVCRRLETDYEPYGVLPDEQRGPDCSCGCHWFHELEGRRGMDWGVCGNPRSPRAGLLTFEHQGGWASGLVQCFEQEVDDDEDRVPP